MSHPPLVTEEEIARQPPEAQAIIRLLLARIAQLEARVSELEAKVAVLESERDSGRKTPQNSSLPPSTQHPHSRPQPEPKNTTGKKRGGQPGHPKHERELIPADQCSEIVPLYPDECRRCGAELAGEDPEPLRHQVWEVPPIVPTVTEYQRHRLPCARCGTTTCADLPCGVPAGQSGPRLTALASLLMAYFRQSKRRAALALETLFNVPSSPGLMVKQQDLVTAALRPCHEELQLALAQATAANLDETGTKQGKHKAWIWTAVTTTFTVFLVRLTRAADVAKELLGDFQGVITTDRYTGYHWHKQRQLCWAHLLRDFQGLIDAGGAGQRIGTQLRNIARQLFHHWHRARDGTISRETMQRNIRDLMWPFYEVLEQGQRCRHARTVTLCNELFKRYDQLWTFLDHADVEPTNNAAERALRHAVIWRKLSFGTQSAAGSRFVETLLTVIETCRQQDRSVVDFVTTAVTARFAGQDAPSLLIEA